MTKNEELTVRENLRRGNLYTKEQIDNAKIEKTANDQYSIGVPVPTRTFIQIVLVDELLEASKNRLGWLLSP